MTFNMGGRDAIGVPIESPHFGRETMLIILLALLMGIVAGLRAMTPPAAVSWAAHLGAAAYDAVVASARASWSVTARSSPRRSARHSSRAASCASDWARRIQVAPHAARCSAR